MTKKLRFNFSKLKIKKHKIKDVFKDILLLVIGALIGVWINNLQSASSNNALKKEYLIQILNDLKLEKENMESHINLVDSLSKSPDSFKNLDKLFKKGLVRKEIFTEIKITKFEQLPLLSNTLNILETTSGYKLFPIGISNKLIDYRRQQEKLEKQFTDHENNNSNLIKEAIDMVETYHVTFNDVEGVSQYFSVAGEKGHEKIEIITKIKKAKAIFTKRQKQSMNEMIQSINALSQLIENELKK